MNSMFKLMLAPALLALSSQSLATEGTRELDRQREISRIKRSMHSQQSGMDAMRARANAAQPRLGLVLGQFQDRDVQVLGVTPGGGADKAGVKAGDLLRAIDDKPVQGDTASDRVAWARSRLTGLQTDQPVSLGLLRAGKPLTLTAVPTRPSSVSLLEGLDALPPDVQRVLRPGDAVVAPTGSGGVSGVANQVSGWSGVNLVAVDPQLGRYFGSDHGVLVLSAGPGHGLRAGDVVLKIGRQEVTTPAAMMQAITSSPSGTAMQALVLRDHVPVSIALPLAEPQG